MSVQLADLRLPSRFACVSVFLIAASTSLGAQQHSGKQLADYVGTYADSPGHRLQIVAGDTLFAVVDEAKYPLHPSGVDQFSTITGQVVSFPRDAKGVVTGYTQGGAFHPRISTTIAPDAAALAYLKPAKVILAVRIESRAGHARVRSSNSFDFSSG